MPPYAPLFWAYICFIAGILGLVMGSFFGCAAWRAVHGESVLKGRSHCCACHHPLRAGDLVPVFSWLALRGKCRYCGAKVPFRYPLAELVTTLVYLSAVLKFGLSLKTLEMAVLGSLLVCVLYADLEARLIPDRFILAGIINRVIFILISGNIGAEALRSLIGGLSVSLPLLIVVLVMERILKKEAMGGGDLKLFFMIGIYFSWKLNLVGLIFACVAGIVFGLISLRRRAGGEDRAIPFGPAIVCGAWLAMLFGDKLLAWYLDLFM